MAIHCVHGAGWVRTVLRFKHELLVYLKVGTERNCRHIRSRFMACVGVSPWHPLNLKKEKPGELEIFNYIILRPVVKILCYDYKA